MRLVFPSYEFILFFLPVCLAGYYGLRRLTADRANGAAIRRGFLALVSVLFYLSFGARNLLILSLQAAGTLLIAKLLLYFRTGRRGLCVYAAGIVLNLLLLCFYKYASPVLPVALSFTTFSAIWFLTDVRSGEITAFDPLQWLSYFFFFPKLLQGPIMRYTDFLERAKEAAVTPPTKERFAKACLYFVLGLSKKVLLADALAAGADLAYSAPADLLWSEAVLTVFVYAFQIYFDFSGYCDMGRAVAWLFGFDLPVNFDRPYRSENIRDFWHRWHATLNAFFAANLYIPLGGGRKGLPRKIMNIMIVFILSGLWHGSGAGFLIWGIAHGLLTCVCACLKKPLPLPRFVKRLCTFVLVSLAWVPFRAESLRDAGTLLRKLWNVPWFVLHDRFIDPFRNDLIWYPLKVLGVPDARTGGIICMWLLLAVSAFLVFVSPDAVRLAEKAGVFMTGPDGGEEAHGGRGRLAGTVGLAAGIALLFVLCILSLGNVSSFVYFNF